MNRCARPSHRQVVIAKEEDGLELKQEVEVLRKNVETQKGLQHTCVSVHMGGSGFNLRTFAAKE